MNPAGAMGTFIRTWRAEWAGLSRAQVAIAVNAGCGKGRRVSEAIVRRWEEGQAPKTTEELEGLCAVMGSHGVFPLELTQFRRAVFAACADSRYPELFSNDEWVHSERLPEIVHDICEREDRVAGSVSIVELLACVTDLTDALSNNAGGRAGRAQTERQQVALVDLKSALYCILFYRGRRVPAAAICKDTSAFIDSYFDGFGPGQCNWGSADWELEWLKTAAMETRSPSHVWSLLETYQHAAERGDRWFALRAARALSDQAAYCGTPAQREAAWHARRAVVPLIRDLPATDAAGFRYSFGRLAERMGFLDEAEGQLEHLQFWQDEDGMNLKCLYWRMAELAEPKGDYGEAIDHYQAAGEVQRRWGYEPTDGNALQISRCEKKLQSANRRKRGRRAI